MCTAWEPSKGDSLSEAEDGWAENYVGGSKSFRPDLLFKVTNKTTLLFFNIVSLYFNTY
jgi:hypothetical protein